MTRRWFLALVASLPLLKGWCRVPEPVPVDTFIIGWHAGETRVWRVMDDGRLVDVDGEED